jgi:hypothetical protein
MTFRRILIDPVGAPKEVFTSRLHHFLERERERIFENEKENRREEF